MIAAIRVVIIREVFCGGFLWEMQHSKSTRDDDVEQSLERGRLDVVDVVTLFKG
jgi:diketogulonate reductase-like aldo/keto reductase